MSDQSAESRQLHLVLGGVPERSPGLQRARRPLTSGERDQLGEQVARAEALVDALDVIEAAYSTVSAALAYDAAVRAATRIGDDVEMLRRVIACLAVEGVWVLPASPTLAIARTDEDIFRRQTQLRVWTWDRRRSVMAGLRRGRRLLKPGPS